MSSSVAERVTAQFPRQDCKHCTLIAGKVTEGGERCEIQGHSGEEEEEEERGRKEMAEEEGEGKKWKSCAVVMLLISNTFRALRKSAVCNHCRFWGSKILRCGCLLVCLGTKLTPRFGGYGYGCLFVCLGAKHLGKQI